MARRQLWVDRTPASDASRRGEQRRLLVELELDDAVFAPGGRDNGRPDQRGGYFPATPYAGGEYQEDQRAYTPSSGNRRPRTTGAGDGGLERRPYSPHGLVSPGRQHANRLSSPYKLKQKVLSSRSSGVDNVGDGVGFHDSNAYHSQRTDRRTTAKGGGVHTSERNRQRRQSGAGGDSRASPTALVRDAIRQNMFLRDQVLGRLRGELVPPVIAVPRVLAPELNVSSSLIRELNRLRTLSLAVVEMVVYLYTQCAANEKKGQNIERRRQSSSADDDEEDAEALEREFFPYLLRMAASDTDFLSFLPALQRFFDAQSVSLSRNPLVEGLSLDTSELLLCSCNYVSASSPTALFSSSTVLASSSSSSSLFQLLIHKLEAFALQTERYLPGWQALPCDRVATALLHLMELETRSNAARLLPTYLRPSLSRENSAAMGSRSTTSIRSQDAPSMYGLAEPIGVSRAESFAELRYSESAVSSTPQRIPAATTYQAWDMSTSDPKPALPPVVAPASSDSTGPERGNDMGSTGTSINHIPTILQASSAAPTVRVSSRASNSAPIMPEAKQPVDSSNTSARLFKKGGGGQKAESPSVLLPATQQQEDPALHASDKGGVDMPAPAEEVLYSQHQTQNPAISEFTDPEPYSIGLPPKEVTGSAKTDTSELTPARIVEQNTLLTPKTTQAVESAKLPSTIDYGKISAEAKPASSRQNCSPVVDYGEEPQPPLIPQLSLYMIPTSTLTTEEVQREPTPVDNDDVALTTASKSLPPSPSRESCVNGGCSPHTSGCRSDVDVSSRVPSVSLEAAPALIRLRNNPGSGSNTSAYSSRRASSTFGSSTDRLSTTASSGSLTRSNHPCSQPVPPNCNYSSGSTPVDMSKVVLSTYRNETAGQEAAEALTMASQIARAMDLLPWLDAGGALVGMADDASHVASSRSLHTRGVPSVSSYRSTSDDDESIAIKRKIELWPLVGTVASGSVDMKQPMSTRSGPVHSTRPDSLFADVNRAAKCCDEAEDAGIGALDCIFDLCRDVQVAAFDLGHRFSEIEVDRSYQSAATALPTFQQACARPTQVVEKDEAPRYLERELKVLRRYFASWRDNAHHQRTVKRRLQNAAAERTIQRFGAQCVAKRRQDQERKRLEEQHAAARAMQKSWAGYAYRKVIGHRSSDFHLVHRCFHRLRFYVGISKRKRQREHAKEKVLRWWRRRRDRIRRVMKREEELRKQRERRQQATRIVKQVLREWILRRQLAKVRVAARQALFKENLKWTKAKRDHERTLQIEQKRQIQWTSMMNASMAELESKWKQSEWERVALQLHYEKVVERHQRTIAKKRREVAAHKIQWFMTTCALKRKLQDAEATRSQTDQQLKVLNAKTEKTDQETQRWRQKMRLEQRLLEKRLAKAEKQMARASVAHESEMHARLSNERQLQEEIACRTIKSFVDRQCLKRRARLDKQRQLQEHKELRAEKQETEVMAAEDLLEHDRGARFKRVLLEDRLAEIHREAQRQLANRDRLLKTKDDEVQRAAEQLQQNRLDASRARLNAWLTQQVRVSRVKKQAVAALTAAAQAMEAEKRQQAELVASQSREMASLKIGAFVTNQVNRSRVKRQEAVTQRRQAELYAKELDTEQRLRSFVVEMIIAVKLQSECEALTGVTQALQRIQQVSDFLQQRRVRLHQLRRIARARTIQRCWRRWSALQQLKREERTRKQQRVKAVKRRECARHIQKEWRSHRRRKAKREAEREKREQKLQRVQAVRRRECARRIQRAWRHFTVQRKQQREELDRRLKRLETIRRRECARHIQTAWRQHSVRKQRRVQERERKRLCVEAARRRECARRIQHAWLASAKRKRRAREDRERQLRAVKLVQRRECAKRIQSAWRQHVQRRRTQRETIKRLKERVRSIRRRLCVRKIQTAWRKAKLRRYEQEQEQRAQQRQQQEQEELKRKEQRLQAAKQRECARKIGVAWRTAKLRQYQLQLEQEELERRLQRVAAIKERECARRIQTGWRQHSGQRQVQREAMDRRVLRVDAVRRRECARHIQSGWRSSRERQRELEQVEEEFRQHMDRRLSELCSRQCARVVQRNWREWHEVQKSTRMRNQFLSLIRTRQAARCIQSNWQDWRRAREEESERNIRFRSIRLRCCARVIQRSWRRWRHMQQRIQWIATIIRHRCAARHIQRAWRGWRLATRQRAEQAAMQAATEDTSARTIQRKLVLWLGRKRREHERQVLIEKQNTSAAHIQHVYRSWKRRAQVPTEPSPTGDESTVQEEVVAMKMLVCSQQIVRAWRRFRHINQFAAATQIGAVWRGRCARQAYALALEVKRAQDERLEEIRLSILAVRVQHCYQDWHVRMRRRKRAEMLARESEMIAQAKRQAKLQNAQRRVSAAHNIQERFRVFSCQETKRKLKSLEQAKGDKEREVNDTLAMLQHEKSDRGELFARVNVGAVVERWMARDLPYILTTGVSSVLVVDAAARVIQRFFRCYQRRALLWFLTKRSSLPDASSPGSNEFAGASDDEFRFYFKRASAWLEWRRTREVIVPMSTLRLRFEAPITRKLLVMLDRQAHSVGEIRHAITEIATDALPIFASDECLRSHEANADRKMPYHDVGELELPHFCALTRSMGKIRSMHRRQQHSASFTATSELSSTSSTASPKSTSSRPRCSRVQSLSVFEAVENASVEDAVFLQSFGVDLGAVEPKMLRNALHLLTFSTENYRFRLEMLDFLLKDGKVDINAMDVNGETPSMLFAAHGHLEFLPRMAKRGADLLLINNNGQNVLHRACEEDQVEIVAFLHCSDLPVSPWDLHVPDRSGRYPLHIVASKGLAECAKQLLSIDEASPQKKTPSMRWDHFLQCQRDSQGRTPLQLAVLARDTAMVSLLLMHGGDDVVNECDEMRRSAVHFAVDTSPSTNAGSTPSTATDALAILTILIEHGASLNIGDERGDTPLHWAAFAGNVALVRFLVTRGADTTAVNSDWETPGQVAAAYGHFACVKAMASSTHHAHRPDTATDDVKAGGSATDRMLYETVNNLAYQQASSQSYHIPSAALPGASPASTRAPGEGYYWEELHQEVQLVDESGRFSSEDESDDDGEDSANDFDL